MRKLIVLFAAAGMALGLASQASAGNIVGGSLSLGIGALPPITIGANAASSSITGTSANFSIPASVAGPTTVVLPATLFTGVPSISGLTVVGLANPALNVVGGAAGGGVAGTVLVNVLQFAALPIPLSVVGASGAPTANTAMAALGAIVITVYGGNGWTTGSAQVTGIVTTTPGTNVLSTVTATGSNNLSGGAVTLIAGFKAVTSVGFILPGFVTLNVLVPEPGTMLLLGSGIAGLALIGRRRMRK